VVEVATADGGSPLIEGFAVAAFSSTSGEFCWVTASIWASVLLTWSMPRACSALVSRCRIRYPPSS
jgi:hypothetical protein